ncbi:methionyl-tRNA formyltransferase [Ohtaekwangia kribbensis]|uniref:Methionyl-tRNA formyltransferase n=1 Tax=Ohtaekwangia kribbensis TaxID=688913 RepID=A0ABW3K507_9BACT
MITLLLMTYKGYKVLEHLIEKDLHRILDSVIVGEDKATENDYSGEIIALCEKNTIKFFRKKENYTITSKYSLAISWRWLIPTENTELIVLHDSLLPKYRGFAPLVNQLINGEKTIGLTAIKASDQYDRGPIITQQSVNIQYPIKIKDAIEIISDLYSSVTADIFRAVANESKLIFIPQDETQATYSLWRDEDDYRIDWTQDSSDIVRFIHAVGYPYLGASTRLEGKKIRIYDAELYPDVHIMNRDSGKIIFFDNDRPVVVCSTGLIKILDAQFDDTGVSIFPLNKFRLRFK